MMLVKSRIMLLEALFMVRYITKLNNISNDWIPLHLSEWKGSILALKELIHYVQDIKNAGSILALKELIHYVQEKVIIMT